MSRATPTVPAMSVDDARGEFDAGAGGLLADRVAIELLPRRLVRRIA